MLKLSEVNQIHVVLLLVECISKINVFNTTVLSILVFVHSQAFHSERRNGRNIVTSLARGSYGKRGSLLLNRVNHNLLLGKLSSHYSGFQKGPIISKIKNFKYIHVYIKKH